MVNLRMKDERIIKEKNILIEKNMNNKEGDKSKEEIMDMRRVLGEIKRELLINNRLVEWEFETKTKYAEIKMEMEGVLRENKELTKSAKKNVDIGKQLM